ncbi:MAG: hypothetical protein JXR88_10170 [Clostridia bacterium]|nr:hypothetical protein [Clostridia bacterium]
MKGEVDPSAADAVTEFVQTLIETKHQLPSGYEITILKADVKERKGNYMFIMRYQILNP